jgi:hypothetical protein
MFNYAKSVVLATGSWLDDSGSIPGSARLSLLNGAQIEYQGHFN